MPEAVGAAAGFRDGIKSGVRYGLKLATLFSLIATVERVLLGPRAFANLGMGWIEIVILYYVAFALGGCGYGALLPLRRWEGLDPAAMMSGVLLVAPGYFGFALLLAPQFGSIPSAFGTAGFVTLLVGPVAGLWRWDYDRERDRQQREPTVAKA